MKRSITQAMTLQFCDTCDVCGQELTEYVGFGIKAGEGDWYCKRCESGEELCIELDSDNVTPVDPFFIDPGIRVHFFPWTQS